jgi:hypothetical protein
MKEEVREEVLRAIVEEAIQRDKDKGLIIDNPSGYFNFKMSRARHQAKEDPNWLIRQKDRLFGSVPAPLGFRICARCGHHLVPNVVYEYNNEVYCDQQCATGSGHRMSLREWMRQLKSEGEKQGTRIDDQGREVTFTVTYEQAARFHPDVAAELEREDNEF